MILHRYMKKKDVDLYMELNYLDQLNLEKLEEDIDFNS